MKGYRFPLTLTVYVGLLLLVGLLGGSWLTVILFSANTGLSVLAGLVLGMRRETERVVVLDPSPGFDEHAAQVFDLVSRERIEGDELGRRLTKARHVEAGSYFDRREQPW